MRFLVTGAGGRVGKRLIETLAATPHSVQALALSDMPHLRLADEVVLENLSHDSNFDAMLDGVDVLIHLADGFNAYEKLPPSHKSEEADARLLTLEKLAKASARNQVKFIYLSTIKTMCGPYADEVLTEQSPARPKSLYGRLKLEAEQAIIETADEQGSTAVILRFPIVFGEGIGGNMDRLVALVDQPFPLPFGGLENRRSLISADSLIDAALTVAMSDFEGQDYFLLQDGGLSIEEMIMHMRQLLGRRRNLISLPALVWSFLLKLPVVGDKVARFVKPLELDDSKFRRQFTWKPHADLRASLAQMLRRAKK